MTVPNRLEALEKGQVNILTEIGDVKQVMGRLVGLQEDWIVERRNISADQDHRFEALMRECVLKHTGTDSRLNAHSDQLKDHGSRLKVVEDRSLLVRGKWTMARTAFVIMGAFIATVGTVTGIVEAITHLA